LSISWSEEAASDASSRRLIALTFPSIISPPDAFQHDEFQHCPASLCLLMTPQYPQFELVWSTLSTTSSVSTFPFIPASNTQNEEAFEDGMNEKIAETEDVVKKGIEKPGV
jgi:hypothetical protein